MGFPAAVQSTRDAQRKQAAERAAGIARAEAERLGYTQQPGAGSSYIADPDETPAAVADFIEGQHGTLEDIPSWANPQEYAQAGAEYAKGDAASLTGDGRFRESQFLMHPRRFEYMQDVGRAVDLLRGLGEKDQPAGADMSAKSSAERALDFWDSSKGAQTTRQDYHRANYQRYGGAEKGAAALITNRLSPIAHYLQKTEILPKALAFKAEPGASWMDAFGRASGNNEMMKNVQLGEVPVLDMATPANGEDQAVYDARYAQRLGDLTDAYINTLPPSDQYVANSLYGTEVPTYTADIIGTARSALDGTGIASLLTGLPVAAVSKDGVLKGLLRQGLQEAVPEAGFTTAVNSVLPARTPSYSAYFMQPMPAEAPTSAEDRNRAEVIAESLGRDQHDSLWNERNKAHRSVVGSLLDYLPSSPTLWGAVQ